MEILATNYTTVKDPKINSLIIYEDAVAAALAVPLTFSSATLEVQAHKNYEKYAKRKANKNENNSSGHRPMRSTLSERSGAERMRAGE